MVLASDYLHHLPAHLPHTHPTDRPAGPPQKPSQQKAVLCPNKTNCPPIPDHLLPVVPQAMLEQAGVKSMLNELSSTVVFERPTEEVRSCHQEWGVCIAAQGVGGSGGTWCPHLPWWGEGVGGSGSGVHTCLGGVSVLRYSALRICSSYTCLDGVRVFLGTPPHEVVVPAPVMPVCKIWMSPHAGGLCPVRSSMWGPGALTVKLTLISSLHPTRVQAFVRKWQLACEKDIAHVVVMPNITLSKLERFVRVGMRGLCLSCGWVYVGCVFGEVGFSAQGGGVGGREKETGGGGCFAACLRVRSGCLQGTRVHCHWPRFPCDVSFASLDL